MSCKEKKLMLLPLMRSQRYGARGKCLRACKGFSGAVAYQQTVLEIPGRMVAVKFMHDAHLSASSHCWDARPLECSRAERKLARNS
ncbi:hypothetical protein EVAR_73283_1 [Eumeta japonica]|uniref:Uncharacterized protein n=1 Tax=Eumeta variegata TaxID=151549 RepID=A0A4C1TI91_EUMVA|nr:hypothetical protein EVAR_73283_1 [Eumeta japonica]